LGVWGMDGMVIFIFEKDLVIPTFNPQMLGIFLIVTPHIGYHIMILDASKKLFWGEFYVNFMYYKTRERELKETL
jgi:hypothetical protein